MTKARISILALLTALLLALCVGAIWPVVGLMRKSDAGWMALVAAIVAIYGVRLVALERAWLRAVLGALLCASSVAYAQYLSAAAVVTSVIGIPFRAVLATMGPEMAYAIARARIGGIDAVLIDAGLVFAALGALLMRPVTTPVPRAT